MQTTSAHPIQLFITGGTIDKDYQTTSGELYFAESHLPKLLKQANSTLTIETSVLMQKDSLEMTERDRLLICQSCIESSSNQIVITHGTDSMVETAILLAQQTDLQHKTIVLTGAMRPFMLGSSDASFNIGSALMAVQTTSPAIYIVMNGQLFNAMQVKKDLQQGLFVKT
ncbi:MAG: L-asparaginase [Thiomicrorhabdus sp.]|nr:MAG: L-asparaginase [Thiomicrorhabdus sp.]